MSPSVWQEETRSDYCICGFHMEPGKTIKKWSKISSYKGKWKETVYEQQNKWLCLILLFFFLSHNWIALASPSFCYFLNLSLVTHWYRGLGVGNGASTLRTFCPCVTVWARENCSAHPREEAALWPPHAVCWPLVETQHPWPSLSWLPCQVWLMVVKQIKSCSRGDEVNRKHHMKLGCKYRKRTELHAAMRNWLQIQLSQCKTSWLFHISYPFPITSVPASIHLLVPSADKNTRFVSRLTANRNNSENSTRYLSGAAASKHPALPWAQTGTWRSQNHRKLAVNHLKLGSQRLAGCSLSEQWIRSRLGAAILGHR